jgi:DNA-binding response OmpR family regulator
MLLTDLLRHDGHNVDAAESASEVIPLLLRNRYSLLITDLEMPKTSGVELIQEVRARGLRLPILIITGDLDAVREAAVLNLGLAGHLPKPFMIAEVRDAVARLLAWAESDDSDTPIPKRYSPG